MKTVGRYQVVRMVDRSVTGSVWIAESPAADGETRFAAKLLDPADPIFEHDDAIDGFYAAARVQQDVASNHVHHWAPVYEIGAGDVQPFFITDYYPQSCRKLIRCRVSVSSAVLHRIVDSIVRGLSELRDTSRRAHGNLKPGNVLIGGHLGIVRGRVVLTDPAPAAGTGGQAEADDLYALGQLVHELVVHAPYHARSGWPITPSAAWQSLGWAADGWRDVCNRLLHPNSDEKTLDAIAEALAVLSPARRRRTLLFRAALAGPPLLAVAALAGTTLLAHSADARLRTVEGEWFRPFAAEVQQPERRERYVADPELRTLVDRVQQAEALDANPGWQHALNPLRARETFRRADALAAASRAAADPNRGQLARLEALAAECRRRRWEQPALYLEETVAAVGKLDRHFAEAVNAVLDIAPHAEAEAAPVEALDARLTARIDELNAMAGETPPRWFATALSAARVAAGRSVLLDDGGWSGLKAPCDAADAADRVGRALASARAVGWPDGVDGERLARDVESHPNDSLLWQADLDDWVAAVTDHAFVEADVDLPAFSADADPRAALRRRLQVATTDLGQIRGQATDPDAFDRESGTLSADLTALRHERFVAKDVLAGRGAFAARFAAVDNALGELRGRYVQLPQDWIGRLPDRIASSATLQDRWSRWIDTLRADLPALSGDADRFAAVKAATEAWRKQLAELDRQFPQAPPQLAGTLAERAAAARERAMAALVVEPAPTPQFSPEAEEAVERQFGEACRPLVESQRKADALLADAQARAKEHDDVGALAAVDAALALDRDHAAKRRRPELAALVEAAQRRAEALGRFEAAAARQDCVVAVAVLDEIERANPADPDLPALRDRAARLVERASSPPSATPSQAATPVAVAPPAAPAAAVKEDPAALFARGVRTFSGRGVPADRTHGRELINRAAAQNNPDAEQWLRSHPLHSPVHGYAGG